ncbi:MAG TPA: cytochrome c oxidase subunit II [Chloroflexota bacterium]|jgi:cytochrome c oxidase subunit 2|nr:cytochrome c oxidase subunit II [Chloroflexota bacterium]
MRRVLLAAPLALTLLASPSSAAAQPWVVAPASDSAEVLSQLFWFTLVLAVIVFVLVEGLLIYSSLRFRRRAPLPLHEPPQIHGNTRLEVMWATVPALILIGLFGITVSRLGDLSQLPTDPNTLRISVTGSQFQWQFGYGSSGVKTTNDLHIPIGTPLIFDVTSTDVIHSFWVPDLYGKIDANPGRVNRITFKAKQTGEFRGVCAELCGAGHAGMQFRVTALSQTDFQQWLQQQSAPPGAAPAAPAAAASPAPQPNTGTTASPLPSPGVASKPSASPAASPAPSAPVTPLPAAPIQVPAGGAPDPALVAAGQQLVAQKGCGGCHTIPGIQGAVGTIGPSLAGVASRTRIAGGVVPNNNPDDLKKWLLNPPALKPGTQMPNLGLTDDEATKIVAFLETLK